MPDAIIVEGPMAGGHLGIKKEALTDGSYIETLEEILVPIVDYVRNELKSDVPIIVAGGVYTGDDIARFIKLGANGVQMATRFIGTEECDAHPNFKQRFIDAVEEDIVFVTSPVGYPGRAMKNKFTEDLSRGHLLPEYCVGCVKPCNGVVAATPYCITEHLIKSVTGDVVDGLVFTGANGYRIKEITTVASIVNEIVGEANRSLAT